MNSGIVVTKFSLKKAFNEKNIPYSQAVFTVDRVLTPDEQVAIKKVNEQVKAYSKTIGFEVDGSADTHEEMPFMDPVTGEVE